MLHKVVPQVEVGGDPQVEVIHRLRLLSVPEVVQVPQVVIHRLRCSRSQVEMIHRLRVIHRLVIQHPPLSDPQVEVIHRLVIQHPL